MYPDLQGKLLQRLQINVVPVFRGLDVPLDGDVLHERSIDSISKPYLLIHASAGASPVSPPLASRVVEATGRQ